MGKFFTSQVAAKPTTLPRIHHLSVFRTFFRFNFVSDNFVTTHAVCISNMKTMKDCGA